MKDLAILIPSWRGTDLLNACLFSIKSSCVTNYDIIVILNQPTDKDIDLLKFYGVKWLASRINLGTLAVDLAIPYIKNKYEYVANLNNDMLVCPEWDKILIDYYEEYDCVSVSSPAVEYNGGNNRVDTLNDPSIPPFIEPSAYENFAQNCRDGKYIFPNCISQRHPIITSVEDYLAVGGYSDNWDQEYFPGYSLDFDFPFRLWRCKGSCNMVSVGAAPVFHDYSATMKKLPVNLQANNCWEYFKRKNGMSIEEFKLTIGFNRIHQMD